MWTSKGGRYEAVYPDMRLWQEIIFMQAFCNNWVVENVVPYYEPFIKPAAEIDRHLFWASFNIPGESFIRADRQTWSVTSNTIQYGFDLNNRKMNHRKDQILRNLVNPEIGLYILEQAQGIIREKKTAQIRLFENDFLLP
jgi:DNA (cytosine-5)-methyltransferase 1